MKLKDANFIDLHIEKVAIAVAVLFVGYVAWAYVVNDSSTAKVNGVDVPAEKLDEELLALAKQLDSKLGKPVLDALANFPVPEYTKVYFDRVASVDPAMLVFGPSDFNRHRLGSDDLPTPSGELPYQPLAIPGPSKLLIKPGMGAIDLAMLTEDEAAVIRKDVTNAQPADVQWVTIAARIDVKPIEELLDEDVDPGMRPIPRQFINETFEFVDVQVQRRRVLDGGKMGEAQLVTPMPARPTMRNMLTSITVNNVTDTIAAMRTRKADLLAPTMYPLKHIQWFNPQFEEDKPAEPGDAEQPVEQDPDREATIARLTRQLKLQRARVSQLGRQLEQARARGIDTTRIQARYDKALAGIAQTQAELRRATEGAPVQPEPRPIRPQRVPEPGMEPGPGMQPVGVLGITHLDVVAHDFGVEPGAKYQYRVRVIASNPLFARRVPKSQADLAQTFALVGEWSDWSQPIATPKRSYFFIAGGQRQVGKAQLEVWKFHDGQWKTAKFSVEPGDPVGRVTDDWELLGQPAANAAAGAQPAPAPVAAFRERIDFSVGDVVVHIDFAHELASSGLGLAKKTTRILFAAAERLIARTEDQDKQEREGVRTQLAELIPEAPEVDPRDPRNPRNPRDPRDRFDPRRDDPRFGPDPAIDYEEDIDPIDVRPRRR